MGNKQGLVILGGLITGGFTAALLSLMVLFLWMRGMMSDGNTPRRWHPVTPTPTPAAQATSPLMTPTPATSVIQPGGKAKVVSKVGVRMRKTPAYKNKPARDVIMVVPPQAVVEVLDGPQMSDGLRWWRVRYRERVGWMAEATAGGIQLLAPAGK